MLQFQYYTRSLECYTDRPCITLGHLSVTHTLYYIWVLKCHTDPALHKGAWVSHTYPVLYKGAWVSHRPCIILGYLSVTHRPCITLAWSAFQGPLWCYVCIINSYSTLLIWPIVSLLTLFILFSVFVCFNTWLYSAFYWISLLQF